MFLQQKHTIHVVHAGFGGIERHQLFELGFGRYTILQGDQGLSAACVTDHRDLLSGEIRRELRNRCATHSEASNSLRSANTASFGASGFAAAIWLAAKVKRWSA